MYCICHHECRFNVTILQLILATDASESSEYLSQYLLTANTLRAMLIVAVPTALLLLVQRFWSRCLYRRLANSVRCIINQFPRSLVKLLSVVAIVASLTLLLASVVECFAYWTTTITHKLAIYLAIVVAALIVNYLSAALFGLHYGRKSRLVAALASVLLLLLSVSPAFCGKSVAGVSMAFNSLQAIPTSFAVFDDCKIDLDRFADVNSQVVVDSASPNRFKIIVLIGESFNKHHAPQYGYPLNTMPRLSAESDSNLFVFNDAVTPYNTTPPNLLDMMSTKSLSDTSAWSDCPIFPAIFRKAGWSVAIIDNQYTKQSSASFDYGCYYFYSTPRMSQLCFDRRNDHNYPFDSEALDACLPDFADSDMLIVHFRGQHLQARDRFPKGFGSFTTADYTFRSDLNDPRRQQMADYDNATLFQDQNIATIIDRFRDDDTIVIFFSDHGEEIYDYRDQYGRVHCEMTADQARCMLQVPYFVWVSDTFRHNHPDKTAAIARAVNYPIRNTDLSHVLLDLAGIHTAAFNPRLSWLNDNYDTHLQRPLDGGQTYEQIINRK
jgi:heptose-I-phosphate ethanolaminephosphotransferase